jgi:hypothetical protein
LLQHLRSFWAKSINSGAFAIGTLILVAVLQQLLAQDLAQGTGRTGRDLYRDVALLFSDLWGITKFILVIPTLFFWLLNRVRPYYLSMLLTMVMITFELVVNVLLLVADPVVNSWQSGYFLARDNVLLALINLHVFALWYYIIEGPIARKALQVDEQRWDFLFPQRASHFIDYWFLAMVTIVTFGPADTLPLSRRAKLLMALEIVISVLTITVLVGRALSAT